MLCLIGQHVLKPLVVRLWRVVFVCLNSEMHRAYQPIVPTSNKYLQLKWDKDNYQKHRTKIENLYEKVPQVENATAIVDTKGPWTPAHIQVKLKKLQLQEERLATITRDNQILSSKLADIMRSNGTVENWNNYVPKSLNAEERHRRFTRITLENQALLQRIAHCESQYKQSKLKEEWERARRVQNNIARYPRGTKSEQKAGKKMHLGVTKNSETAQFE